MRPHFLLCFPLAAGLLLAQPRIEGRVVDAVTGEAVAGATVMLRALPPLGNKDSDTAKTDGDGPFEFGEVPAGSYILAVNRSGYREEVYSTGSGGSVGTPLTVAAGQVIRDIVFKLTPLGVLSGSVVDEDGRPVASVMVTALPADRAGTIIMRVVTTGQSGEFRVPNLAAGSYTLVAAPQTRSSEREVHLATYYPSATEAAGAVPLHAGPGQVISGLVIVLQKGRLSRVRGTVVMASQGLSPADVRVVLTGRRESGLTLATSLLQREKGGGSFPSEDGSFDLGLVSPGSYYLRAESRSDSRVILGRVPLDVRGEDLDGVVLVARQPLRADGAVKVEGEDELDLARTAIQFRRLGEGPQIYLQSTLSGEDTFAIEDVPADRYAVVVSGLPGNAYVKSVRMGGRETIDSGLDLTNLEAVPPLEILVSPNGASVGGLVKQADENSAPGAWVCLIPDPARPELADRVKSVTAGVGGRYSFTGVPPGEYRLYAFERSRLLSDLESLKPFESKAANLSIREGERKQVDVKLLGPTDSK